MKSADLAIVETLYKNLLPDDGGSRFLDHLLAELVTEHNPQSIDPVCRESIIKGRILPHVQNALCLLQKLKKKYRYQPNLLPNALNYLPAAAVIIDDAFNVIAHNARFNDLLTGYELFGRQDDKLTMANDIAEFVKDYVTTQTASENDSGVSSPGLVVQKPNQNIRVFIETLNPMEEWQHYFIILVFQTGALLPLSTNALQDYFSMTRAEVLLVSALVNGITIKEYARDRGIAENTARVQLRSIFQKTGVNRIPELLKVILMTPTLWSKPHLSKPAHPPAGNGTRRHGNGDQPITAESPENRLAEPMPPEQLIQVATDRQMSYTEYGQRHHFPVMFIHDKPDCPYARTMLARLATQNELRFIVPDRPGYGRSTPWPALTFLKWAGDVEQLVAALGLKTLAVIGYGAGGPYAAACALRLAPRIKKLTLCNSYSPDFSDHLDSVEHPREALMLHLAKYLPATFSRWVCDKLPAKPSNTFYFHQFLQSNMKPYDLLLLEQHRFMQGQKGLQAGAIGWTGLAKDYLLLSRNWGFNIKPLLCDTEIWHGKQNPLVPLRCSKRLAEALPAATLRLLDNAGHYLPINYWQRLAETIRHHHNREPAAAGLPANTNNIIT